MIDIFKINTIIIDEFPLTGVQYSVDSFFI